ncbi:hypothetical protein DENSPDRAFT_454717 [Dentipellis sp. KUC8613]|nr:hypothetical protein DENSPDRAFT_454717 [Dentipellis sp. KUC8613]
MRRHHDENARTLGCAQRRARVHPNPRDCCRTRRHRSPRGPESVIFGCWETGISCPNSRTRGRWATPSDARAHGSVGLFWGCVCTARRGGPGLQISGAGISYPKGRPRVRWATPSDALACAWIR